MKDVINISRLLNKKSHAHSEKDVEVDDSGRIRLDDWEMEPEIQNEIIKLWPEVTTENLMDKTNFAEYQREFLKLFGFGFDAVNYDQEVDLLNPFQGAS